MFYDGQSSPIPQFVPPSTIPTLLEWTLLIVPPALLQTHSTATLPPLIDILHCLCQTGFSLSEMTMVQFTANTAKAICDSVGPCSLEVLILSLCMS